MNHSRISLPVSTVLAIYLLFAPAVTRPARGDEDLVQTVSNLLADKDKDVRAVGLEQVREQVKGAEATLHFAGLLPKLAPEAQVGLLGALAERGDVAARPAVLEMVEKSRGDVCGAAIRALGSLGNASDVPRLVKLLAGPETAADAVMAVTRLKGTDINAALCGEMKTATPGQRVKLIDLLVARHAIDSQATLLESAKDSDAGVRIAALTALGQLAGPDGVARMAHLVLDAKDAAGREEAERALALISQRESRGKADREALPLLKVMSGLSAKEKTALLPALGRLGGKPALKMIEADIAGKDPQRRAAALQGLCNWPDGSVAPQLAEIAAAAQDPAERKLAVDALIRIAPLPDKRPDTVRLKMLKKAMELSSSKEQKALVLKRASAILSIDTLRFVEPYLDQPEFCAVACKTVVELAHHKELRQPNKAEFDKALDQVISLTKDKELLLRANHYKRNETWVEKQIKGK